VIVNDRDDRVSFSGGTYFGPVAGGTGAQAVQYGAGVPGRSADLRAELAQLRELIRASADELDEVEGALRDVDDVEAEATREQPDRRRLRDAIGRLGERVAKVAAVATAVYHVQELVRELVP
jgi:chromosome segregation ATPase